MGRAVARFRSCSTEYRTECVNDGFHRLNDHNAKGKVKGKSHLNMQLGEHACIRKICFEYSVKAFAAQVRVARQVGGHREEMNGVGQA
eukprot:5300248-Pleurochrysis_carterae.AAC.1